MVRDTTRNCIVFARAASATRGEIRVAHDARRTIGESWSDSPYRRLRIHVYAKISSIDGVAPREATDAIGERVITYQHVCLW